MLNSTVQKLNTELVPLVHNEKLRDAALLVSQACRLDLKIDSEDPAKVLPPLNHWLHFLLNLDGGMTLAAQLLWTPTQFNPAPQYTQDIWDLVENANFGLLMGSASTSKSYSTGVRFFLEWLRDPKWTSINVIGPSEDHLERNLFSHLVELHQSAKMPMPGEIGKLWIGADRRNQLGAISGIVIPISRTKKAGKLQGGKRKPRPESHPLFGPLSRVLILIDELENVPGGIWHDIDNVMSLTDTHTKNSGFKLFAAFNPTDQNSEAAKRAEPLKGWNAFDIDNDYRWKSIRGWDVLRLDGEKCENVVQGKTVFPGLQTKEGLEQIARNAGGKNSPGYTTMGRGAYPKQGVEMTIIPPGFLGKLRGEYIWLDTPKPAAGVDLALEGGAACIFSLGFFGMATGMKLVPSLEYPNGRVVMFKESGGSVVPRHGLELRQQFLLEKGDTIATATRVIDMAKKLGVRPHLLAADRTGVGSGVADVIKHIWSGEIHDINFTSGASKDKIMAEDTKTCHELYERMWSELWFALRFWGEFNCFLINPAVDLQKLGPQLTQRQFQHGIRSKVESKADFKVRGYESPDEADSATLLVHAVRKGGGVIPSMKGAEQSEGGDSDDDSWFTDAPRIDESNRSDVLEDAIL